MKQSGMTFLSHVEIVWTFSKWNFNSFRVMSSVAFMYDIIAQYKNTIFDLFNINKLSLKYI